MLHSVIYLVTILEGSKTIFIIDKMLRVEMLLERLSASLNFANLWENEYTPNIEIVHFIINPIQQVQPEAAHTVDHAQSNKDLSRIINQRTQTHTFCADFFDMSLFI